jgi:SAM-dependent methyltransferase
VGITTPFPSAGEIEALYPPTHYGSGGPRYRPAIERVARWFRERRAAWITRRHAPGAVLEVGCGHGYMLAGLRDRGWRVQGVELHEHSARYGRDLLGLPIAVGDFTTLGLPGASFDVVVFWHSFEHLGEPLAALREAARLVKPGGLVIIAVPNMGSWQARWAGARWFHWEIPRHLYHYDVPSLETLLGRAHLQVTYVSHANWEQNPFGWMQSILNRLGFPSNQFFTGLWAVPDGGESGRPIVQRILAGPVLAAGFVLAAMETLCRRGGTITLVARRPPH